MPKRPASRPSGPPSNPPAKVNDQTRPSQKGVPRGKLPHERDQSADTQSPMPDQDIADLAHADAVSERVDTDRALGSGRDGAINPDGGKER